MNYQEALDYLYTANIYGIRPGLERMRSLMARLGHPEMACPAIHIAGTNGKGSVSSYCAHIAAAAGKKVGWYTSPYLEHFLERIRILDGRQGLDDFARRYEAPEIPEETFASYMTRLREVIARMRAEGEEQPTVFEMETAVAFLWFAAEHCDLMVLEVGLGGRLDATNVISRSLISLVAALGYDHMDRLGNTLPEIAAEKAGIIKPGCPLVLYDPRDAADERGEGAAALAVIEQKAAELKAPLTLLRAADIVAAERTPDGQVFREKASERKWVIHLWGDYQQMNARLAIAACRHFTDDETIAEGLRRTRWPGRLELLRRSPAVLIDGAHNLQGCTALAEELAQRFPGQPMVYMTGMLGDKEHRKMLQIVLGSREQRPLRIYVSRPPVPRGLPALRLAQEIQEVLAPAPSQLLSFEESMGSGESQPLAQQEPLQICCSDDYPSLTRAALAAASQAQVPLVIFGSLYLIGNARPVLRKELEGAAVHD